MKAWTFTTEDHVLADRPGAWRRTLESVGMAAVDLPDGTAPRGRIIGLASPLGLELALVETGVLTLRGPRPDLPETIWLAALIEGRARLSGDGSLADLGPGDMAYGPVGRMASLEFSTRSRLLWIRAPRMALGHRLIGAGGLPVGVLPGDAGLPGVFAGLLSGLAGRLADLSKEDLRPVESAIADFLAALLADLPGGEAAKGALQVSRVSQIVETLLPDADLTLKRLAEASGLAPRSLQKLLAAAGQTFSGYVRDRRLERCRADLESPLAAGQSIGEIAARWGFADPAYFSRAFRNAYGASPREWRKRAG